MDFSSYAENAVRCAVPLASAFQARLIFVHVMPILYPADWKYATVVPGWGADDPLQYEMKQRLASLAKSIVPSEITTEIQIRRGLPADEIMNLAREMAVDLIVMSTHGHTGRVHAFLGSVAADVTRLAPCPVLVARGRNQETVTSLSRFGQTGLNADCPAAA